ncbi:uncharacterized protein BYT42DRAFT_98825 [Radiomyces spectabilis]|uniref:uncharacterized protein n=1 Tax=Radiomyces spectabilis TaxID=64574 RepID=UPI0022208078|nr:uncharacterized protein BYT42DRAFT_98825 [Radiomyces spectabilis]KAI8370686.1 hypothetical protein BYT42DRAFT_98825 [Radiomyces spectabilis]
MHNKADFGYPVRIIDTPGFGDSQLRDSEFFPMIREQLIDLIQQPLDQGGGIHCIFLVYKMTSSIDAIFTSLNIFHELIQPFTGVWENVVLVFTHAEPSTLHYHQQYKMKLKTKVSLQIKEKYQLTKALPMVFLSTQTYTCSYLKGLGECDCERGHRYHADCRRRLYEQVKIRSTRPFHLDDCEYPPSSLSPTMEMSTIQESSLME